VVDPLALQEGHRAVAGPVVDHDQLDVDAGLGADRLHADVQVAEAVPARDHDRDRRWAPHVT
jgi:hypothetical protein